MSTKVRILGISGSPRKANTDIMVKEALKAAETLGDVETKFISVAGKNIKPCVTCYRCYTGIKPGRFCPTHDDDMQEFYERMLWADGWVVGSPVYWANITAQLKAVIDRTMPFCHYSSTPLKGALGHKVIGALAIAYDVHGGQELTINMIHNWAMVQDMIVVGSGPQRPVVCYYGGACHQWPSSDLKAVKDKPDGLGLKSCRSTGMKVAEITKIVRAGLEAIGYEESYKYLFEKGGFDYVKIKN